MTNIIIPPPPNPPSTSVDKDADKEQQAFEKGRDLGKEGAENDFDQRQFTKHILACVVRALIVVLGLVLMIGILIWTFHLLAPECLRWLTKDEIIEIQHLMTSALLGMVASEYARKLSN